MISTVKLLNKNIVQICEFHSDILIHDQTMLSSSPIPTMNSSYSVLYLLLDSFHFLYSQYSLLEAFICLFVST